VACNFYFHVRGGDARKETPDRASQALPLPRLRTMAHPSQFEGATMKRKVQKDFFERRLSILGLARKYGKTRAQIEEVLRW
jgi:hypothetical protein